jgi:3-oxoacyl-[acyl-carrier-protein] synthase-3
MARWEIKNVGMKGVAMTVPENVVKTGTSFPRGS